MGAATTPKGEGFSGGCFRHGGSGAAAFHRSRSRQPFRGSRGCPFPWNFRSHLQAHEREDMCRSAFSIFQFMKMMLFYQ